MDEWWRLPPAERQKRRQEARLKPRARGTTPALGCPPEPPRRPEVRLEANRSSVAAAVSFAIAVVVFVIGALIGWSGCGSDTSEESARASARELLDPMSVSSPPDVVLNCSSCKSVSRVDCWADCVGVVDSRPPSPVRWRWPGFHRPAPPREEE